MDIEYNVFTQIGEYKVYSHKFTAKKEISSANKIKQSDFPLPEVQENKSIVWNGSGWVYIDNYTDKTFYNIETREKKTLELGEAPDETLTEFIPLVDEKYQILTNEGWEIDDTTKTYKDKLVEKSNILKNLNDQLIQGFEYNGSFWSARDKDRADLTGEILSWETGADSTPFWRNKANQNISMSKPELLALAKAMKEFYQEKFFESRIAIDALNIVEPIE